MTGTKHHGQWQVEPNQGEIHMKSSRIGFFSANAKAPITGGEADWAPGHSVLTFTLDLTKVTTGKSLLDPEVRALIKSGSDGSMIFTGTGTADDDSVTFDGTATCGNIVVPIVLTGTIEGDADAPRDVVLEGTASFDDIHLPIPGFGNIKHVDVFITGTLQLRKP